jgi:hypothetical protein
MQVASSAADGAIFGAAQCLRNALRKLKQCLGQFARIHAAKIDSVTLCYRLKFLKLMAAMIKRNAGGGQVKRASCA